MKSFNSFAGLAAELAVSAAGVEHLNKKMLEACAVMIEDRAKEKIGEYQGAAGQFVEWAPLAESTIADKEAKGFAPPDNPLLRTGEMRDSIEHKVVGDEAYVGSDSDIAVYQELGTDKIPPRSFLGGSAFEKAPEVVELVGRSVTLHLSGQKVPDGKQLIQGANGVRRL